MPIECNILIPSTGPKFHCFSWCSALIADCAKHESSVAALVLFWLDLIFLLLTLEPPASKVPVLASN